MAEKSVFLHVGTPKTGTSGFQHALFTQPEKLAELGVSYPAEDFDTQFRAALDLMDLPWGGLEQEARHAWGRLADAANAATGRVIISHEILGRASRLQVERALGSLDGEIHVVVTARDLARQLPAEWQENVKHRRTITYTDFLDAVRDPQRTREIAQWFWSVQELPDILARWGGSLPPEQVHVVTVPPAGSAATLLGDRLAAAFGIDPVLLRPTGERANASLGVAESALIRALNERLDVVLPNHHYRQFVRELLVHQNLGASRKSPRLTLPPDVHDWASELSHAWVAELREQGYDVVGDLGDLIPIEQTEPFVDPDDADPGQVAEAGVRALAASIQENARLRDVEIELHEIIDDLMRQLDEAHLTPAYKARERLVGLADTNPVARAGLAGYRRLRGRNSRPT
ncbi:MAG TPA: hypothetical protein VF426_12685 [Marmoricola sp.]